VSCCRLLTVTGGEVMVPTPLSGSELWLTIGNVSTCRDTGETISVAELRSRPEPPDRRFEVVLKPETADGARNTPARADSVGGSAGAWWLR
jgi:hypothetical protein